MKTLTQALRPWTIDFHVAQNDATVKGSGTHDKTGHHCLPTDPDGKLTIPHHAGYWLHADDGKLTKTFRHICWDGCMFPNAVMMKQNTWNDILRVMIAVRDAHGWREESGAAAPPKQMRAELRSKKAAPKPAKKPAKKPAAKAHRKKTAKRAATAVRKINKGKTVKKSTPKKKAASRKVTRKVTARRQLVSKKVAKSKPAKSRKKR